MSQCLNVSVSECLNVSVSECVSVSVSECVSVSVSECLSVSLYRIHQEMLSRYGLDLGNLYSSVTPPHPPPRPPRSTGEGGDTDESAPPTYKIIPWVKCTAVELKFRRRHLEEFMDR